MTIEDTLKSLVKKRASVKTQVTLFENYCKTIDIENVESKELKILETRLEKIEPLFEIFIELQNEISCIQETEHESNELESFQNKYFTVLAEANIILNKHKQIPIDTQSQAESIPSTNQSFITNTTHKVGTITLPTINLPLFDGTFTQWHEFKDKFMSLIHNNNELSDTQKLTYLKSSLKSEPADLLRALETIDANYAIAWSRLEKRYNNKRRIVNNHVQALLDIQSTSRESFQTLRNLINTTQNHLDCLKTFDIKVNEWSALLIPILASKLDASTNKEWEAKLNRENQNMDKIPTIEEFLEFLNIKQNTLEITSNRNKLEHSKLNPMQQRNSRDIKTFAVTVGTCINCNNQHLFQNCEEFRKLNVTERNERARELKVCLNCLRKGHFTNECQSINSCRKCNRRHHTALHISPTSFKHDSSQSKNNNQNNTVVTSCVTATSTVPINSEVLLSTAKVIILDCTGKAHEMRVLLDSASQSNFITERACKLLNLSYEKITTNVTGINNTNLSITKRATVNIKSRVNNFNTTLCCLVIPQITNNLPTHTFKYNTIKIPQNISLADPTFYQSSRIDLLIGATLFYELMCVGQVKTSNSPTWQKTKLGWVASGTCMIPNVQNTSHIQTFFTLSDLHTSVERFWNADELEIQETHMTPDETYCEKYYATTTTRDATGKFIVRIPFKENKSELGDSSAIAKSRFLSMEKRLTQNAVLKSLYTDFMNEYINLGHMTKLQNDDTTIGFYLPHHAVLNECSQTTKLRVVFDGSCKLDDGLNINSVQHIGPTIQDELLAIVARFRTYRYVLTADVAKMYRQIWIHEQEREYQKIFWRSNPNDTLDTYKLNTVTYGTTSAPYLATRSLLEVAVEHANSYPLESNIIRHDFYVDDLLTGSDSLDTLKIIKHNVSKILQSAGFELRKWQSNSELICKNNLEQNEVIPVTDNTQKTLGVYWTPHTDTLSYTTKNIKYHSQVTKRTILATTSQLFDPLGLLGPVIIVAKLIIQSLWKSGVGWDESIPLDIQTQWLRYQDSLQSIDKIKIPRHVIHTESTLIEIHGFSDASTQAYGACIYLRSINQNNEMKCMLFAAKSKVVPIKFTTIPRLELSAAVLLAKLVKKVKSMLQIKITNEIYWCDSQIVLCWIKSHAPNYQTYVANRITQIQTITNIEKWHYVQSKENPADFISRGITPKQLAESQLWWHGPLWLSQAFIEFKDQETLSINDIPECKINKVCLIVNHDESFPIKNYSCLTRLQRIIAYCLRFKKNCFLTKQKRLVNTLTISELDNALQTLARIVQKEHFKVEYEELESSKCVNKKSSLLKLTPFLDDNNLIRVGGRLELSDYSFDKKHPIILPKQHHLTILIFQYYHKILLHAGATLLLNSIRERFWPINGKATAKRVVRGCVICSRYNPQIIQPIMGNLPRERTIIMHPFHSTGIDYAGPFTVKDRKGKGAKLSKTYLCLFVCFSTKAVHLELVSELTTAAFLAALRRFISRRGKPLHIFSDNGKTFVGAKNELYHLGKFLKTQSHDIELLTSSLDIQWHFSPPYAPNFGGLWEAGVKSAKFHIKRVVGQTVLIFEDLLTLLTQIEAILNSRPLTPLTSDPNDNDILTPAHFLIGRPYTTIPDPNVSDIATNRLNRFEHLQKMTQHFWQKWRKSYVAELQQRHRWNINTPSIQVGSMVVVKDDNAPPARWKLGRIVAVHPGKDNVIRVVTVKCAHGEIKRSLAKLCLLPSENCE